MHSEPIICPNCGNEAEKNFCSQCGQATHLHKETFVHLVTHFFAHYFHYESKLWQTFKTLVTKPGTLTVAYRNKQRMRYVPPMSLYFFTVIAYFILNSAVSSVYEKIYNARHNQQTSAFAAPSHTENGTSATAGKKAGSDKDTHVRVYGHFDEAMGKVVSKLFFLMVPVFAFFLRLLFIKRKDLLFIDHAVFSFHLYTILCILLLLLDIVYPFHIRQEILFSVMLLLIFVYCVRALMVVYNVRWPRAIACSAVAIACNAIVFFGSLGFVVYYLLDSSHH